jgi:hypothetical protein
LLLASDLERGVSPLSLSLSRSLSRFKEPLTSPLPLSFFFALLVNPLAPHPPRSPPSLACGGNGGGPSGFSPPTWRTCPSSATGSRSACSS